MCVCASVGELDAQINKSSKLEAVDICVFPQLLHERYFSGSHTEVFFSVSSLLSLDSVWKSLSFMIVISSSFVQHKNKTSQP